MPEKKRETQLQRGARATAAAAALGSVTAPAVQARGANERMVMGLAGCGVRGPQVAEALRTAGVQIAYACDPDRNRAEKAKNRLEADQATGDLRKILDDPAVDAIVLATPDHWHAPAAVLACQAGKHVYVEKPCSHSIAEGRMMIDAARRANRVMQVGTQTRGTKVFQDAIARVHEGAVGKVLFAKAWVSHRRPDIGKGKPCDPPAELDYDTFVGPVPMFPYQDNLTPYNWHWFYHFGVGEAGNRGVHQLDIATWGLGVATHPSRVTGFGEKLIFDDDQQFPDTQYVTFEYPGDGGVGEKKLLVYEQRIWSRYPQDDYPTGVTFYGDEGYLTMDMHKNWLLYGPKNRLREEGKGYFDTGAHCADFIDAIRNNRRPTADIEIGNRSAVLSHLANIVARTEQRSLAFDPAAETFIDAPDANALVSRDYREGHWAAPNDA